MWRFGVGTERSIVVPFITVDPKAVSCPSCKAEIGKPCRFVRLHGIEPPYMVGTHSVRDIEAVKQLP